MMGKTPSISLKDQGDEKIITDLEDIAMYLNFIIFGVYMILQLFVLYRIRMTLDLSALVTLTCYSITIICRFAIWLMYKINGRAPDMEGEGKAAINLIDLASCIVIWLVLYFFIFEMRIVQDKLQSDTPTEFKIKRTVTLRSRLAVMLTAAILMSIIYVIGAIYNISINNIPDDN